VPQRLKVPQPATKPTSTLTLSDTVLMAIMGRPDLKTEFPFLRVALPKVTGGSCCGGARQAIAHQQTVLDMIKRQLISLPLDKKNRFKELLRTDQVVVFLGGSQRVSF